MILHLFQELPYLSDREQPDTLSLAYRKVLDRLDRSEIGSEACLCLSSVLAVLRTGFQEPPTEEMRLAVEQGQPLPERPGDLVIEPGDYRFVQIPGTPSPETIGQVLEPLAAMQACDGASPIYLRIFKENLLETVVQALWKA
jgi:hypothetical protein